MYMPESHSNNRTTAASKSRAASAITTTATSPSRLQRRRPASLKITPASSTYWSSAIPLLSPLDTSPTVTGTNPQHPPATVPPQRAAEGGVEKPVVFKKWQHPAAPFHYDTPPSYEPSFYVPA